MDFPKLLQNSLLALLLAGCGQAAMGQTLIRGTIYDRSQRFGLQGVSVMGSSGAGAVTDSLGHYSIRLSRRDSIYFSYLGKFTARYPVKQLDTLQPFDMSLEVGIDSLPPVIVQTRNYLQDSLETRRDYAKIFDYQADYLDNLKAPKGGRGMGVGLDLDMLLSGAKVRRMLAFQKRLVEEEQDNYVDHRFNPGLVHRITGLESPALDSFMRIYRPSYEFLQGFSTDYEYYKYISDCGKFYSANN